MPFCLTNAPATFQALMNAVFSSSFWGNSYPFLTTFSSVAHHGNYTFSILAKPCNCYGNTNCMQKASKCIFAVTRVDYLGHLISARAVEVDPRKIAAVSLWHIPDSVLKALRGFIGLTGYYWWFVHDYGSLCRPLTDLLRKGEQFCWTHESDSAFNALKEAMTSTPVLALPNFEEKFVIEADASSTGMGAVLCQRGHLIAFASKRLSLSK